MEKKGEVTIYDIAKKLKIAASTVSRALNHNPIVSESTRRIIEETAAEMGYRPNIMAANFRSRRTNTIGVILPLINRHFFSSVISGIEDIAYKNGFTVTISQSNDLLEKEIKIAQTFFANRVDGVIISIGMGTNNTDHLKLFSQRNVPIVFFDRIVDEISANKIVVDDYRGGFMATDHLIQQGAKRIAHIGGPLNLKIYQDRLAGYKAALENANLHIYKSMHIHNSLTIKDGARAIKKLLHNGKVPDAIFCANDHTALSAVMNLRKNGYEVPKDVLVVGFSNEPFSEVVTPAISTIKQPGFEMGQKAAELLIDEIKIKDVPHSVQTMIMTTELIVRESSVKPKPADH